MPDEPASWVTTAPTTKFGSNARQFEEIGEPAAGGAFAVSARYGDTLIKLEHLAQHLGVFIDADAFAAGELQFGVFLFYRG